MSKEFYDAQPTERKIRPGALALGAFFALALHEASATIVDRRKRSDEPVVISKDTPGAVRSTLYVPGFHANGPVIGSIQEPMMKHNMSRVHIVGWDTSGFRSHIAKEKTFEALSSDDGIPLSVELSSWGIHPFADWMSDPDFREPLNNREVTIVADSNFYDVSDISRSTRMAMYFTRILPPTFTPGKLFETAMGMDTTDVRVHDQNVTDQQMSEWKKSSAKSPYGAAMHQVTDILRRRGNYPNMTTAFQNVSSFRYVSAIHDPVANPYSSFRKFSSHFEGGLAVHYVDTDRPVSSHAMAPAYTDNIAKLLYFTDDELAEVLQLKKMPDGAKSYDDYLMDQEYELAMTG
jgi:hypothetical protein